MMLKNGKPKPRQVHLAALLLIIFTAACRAAPTNTAAKDGSLGTLKGRIVPAPAGTTISISKHSDPPEYRFLKLPKSGEFEVSVSPGKYSIGIGSPGYRPQLLTDLVVTAGNVTDLGEIKLQVAAAISGRITSLDPQDEVMVYAFRRLDAGDPGYQGGLSSPVDPKTGSYKIQGLDPTGVYDLSIASVKHGIRCFVQRSGPVYGTDAPLSKELQARLNRRA